MSDTQTQSAPPPVPEGDPPPEVEGDGDTSTFPCGSCGASLQFQPGTKSLICQYCGHENLIAESDETIDELDFLSALSQGRESDETMQESTIQCQNCAAQFSLDPNIQSDECPFCGTTIVTEPKTASHLKPKSLLPFKLNESEAREAFRRWLSKLWFAPNKVKQYARQDHGLNGMYVPYWTYDADTATRYRGMRGRRYTTTVGSGKNRRTVTRIRWTPVSGDVSRFFDDVLVLASNSLPRKQTEKLEPWDLENLVPYTDSYLSGFRSETYQVDLEGGFGMAKQVMDRTIRGDVRRDIGGDAQRITWMSTRHSGVTYKHILLPIWCAAYRFQDRAFRFVVNARTGEVHGERPWSWIKIAAAVIGAAVLAGGGYFVFEIAG